MIPVEQGEAGSGGEKGRQRQRLSAPQRGRKKCEHNRQRSTCKDCGGACICQHNRKSSQCKNCGVASICEHNHRRSICKDCGGASICEHNRRRSPCKDPTSATRGITARGAPARTAGSASICEHNRESSTCKDCGGTNICEHTARGTPARTAGIVARVGEARRRWFSSTLNPSQCDILFTLLPFLTRIPGSLRFVPLPLCNKHLLQNAPRRMRRRPQPLPEDKTAHLPERK